MPENHGPNPKSLVVILERVAMLRHRFDKALKERMRAGGARSKLWVELAAHHERMIRQLPYLHQAPVRRQTREYHASIIQQLAVEIVHLKAVAVPLLDNGLAFKHVCIGRRRSRAGGQLAGI